MDPRARRMMHEALDLLLDAMALNAGADVPKKTRQRPPRVRTMPEGVSDLTVARAEAAAKKAGLL